LPSSLIILLCWPAPGPENPSISAADVIVQPREQSL
jgi:hypothetical protein